MKIAALVIMIRVAIKRVLLKSLDTSYRVQIFKIWGDR